jgi:hypothetical protein
MSVMTRLGPALAFPVPFFSCVLLDDKCMLC